MAAQAGDDGALGKNGGLEAGKKGTDSVYINILEVQLIRFADRLDVGGKGKNSRMIPGFPALEITACATDSGYSSTQQIFIGHQVIDEKLHQRYADFSECPTPWTT